MSTQAKLWHAQFISAAGSPVAGVKIYHYSAGTTTDKDVYRDQGKTTTDTQPVQGDSAGFVSFYGDGTYRLKVVDNNGILLYDLDSIEITGANTGTESRILFYGSSGAITDDDDLTWDSTNKRLAVGTKTNITEALVLKPGGFIAAERTGAGSNEGAKRLIGLNTSNKVSIDPQGQGAVFETLPTKGLLYLDANGQIQVLTLTDGQFPIGDTNDIPVANQPTAGDGVTITTGPGTATFKVSTTQVLDRTVTQLDIQNTVTETTLYSVVVPAGMMGANKSIRTVLAGAYVNNTGANRTFTLKVKFGGTVIFQDDTLNITTNAAARIFALEFELTNRTTTSQFGLGRVVLGQASAATSGTGDLGTAANFLDALILAASSTADTSATQAFEITITHSAADTNLGRYWANTIVK